MIEWEYIWFAVVGVIVVIAVIWAIVVVIRQNKRPDRRRHHCNRRRTRHLASHIERVAYEPHAHEPQVAASLASTTTAPEIVARVAQVAQVARVAPVAQVAQVAQEATPQVAQVGPQVTRETPVQCPPTQVLCRDECVSFMSDSSHCGGCDRKCADGYKCKDGECVLNCLVGLQECDGMCVDTQSSEEHCGQCGKPCRAGDLCIDGKCTYPCPAGMVLCHGQCIAGACIPICLPGQRFCERNGRCTDVLTDAQHCSDCNVVCAPRNATGRCQDGHCEIGECHTGFAHCEATAEDVEQGCETNILNHPRHCGGCNRPCPITAPFCINGACSSFPVL